MKKRLIAAILTLCMLVSLMPMSALAADEAFDQALSAHDCDEAASVEVDTFADLRTALQSADDTDVIVTADIPIEASITVNGTKHLYTKAGKSYTLSRGPREGVPEKNMKGDLLSVAEGAKLILGDGELGYTGKLEDAAKAGDYEVKQTGGELILDGGAVWEECAASSATVYFLNESGQRVSYDNTGISQTNNSQKDGKWDGSLIYNGHGTLDIWQGVTLQNNHKWIDQGSAINMLNLDVNKKPTLNLYGGVIRRCATTGLVENGTGAIYCGNNDENMVSWTTCDTSSSYGTINFYAGAVRENGNYRGGSGYHAGDGTGIALDKAVLNLYGGSVSYNCGDTTCITHGEAADGGGIGGRVGAVLNLYGGSIDHNWTAGFGGGVCLWNSSGYLYGTSITENRASYGAGVAIAGCSSSSKSWDNKTATFSTFRMEGGTIAYNEALQLGDDPAGGVGGGICAGTNARPNGSVLDLRGGLIRQNKARYGGGIGAYAGSVTALKMSGDASIVDNAAYEFGNGAYVHADESVNSAHPLLYMEGAATIDTNNPVYFDNLLTDQIPVQVNDKLTTAGTAAVLEMSDAIWNAAQEGQPIIQFAKGKDVQENKFALDSTAWYLKANTDDNRMELHQFTNTPQYTIRNGTLTDEGYYRVYDNLKDAFAEAKDGDSLYIFYNTTIDTTAVVENGKHITLLAESTSSAGVAAATSGGKCSFKNTDHGYYVMTGSFRKYNSTTGYYDVGDLEYNIRNDYTITLSSALSLGDEDLKTGYGAQQAAVIVEENAELEIGQASASGMGAGALTFDGNYSYPLEGPMFQVKGTMDLQSGVTVKNHTNYSEAHPGAIEVQHGGTLNMQSGVTLRKNVSPIAGAVYVGSAATFNMYGGTMEDNTGAMPRYGFIAASSTTKFTGYDTAYWGQPKYYYGAGAVYSMGDFAMSGGTIDNNAGEYGGVAGISGTLEMTGGSVTNNAAVTGIGAAAGVPDDYRLDITGYTEGALPAIPAETTGDIDVDYSPGAGTGGGLYIAGCQATVNKGSVSGNYAQRNGGGIALGEAGGLAKIVTGYTDVTGAEENKVVSGAAKRVTAKVPTYESANTGAGGGIVKKGHVDLRGSLSISGNTAGNMGGGLFVWGNQETLIVAAGVTCANNTAKNGGGVAASEGSTVVLHNEVASNTATGLGGGVYATQRAEITATGRVIDNSADAGGAAYVDEDSALTLDGAWVNNNKISEEKEGTGVYVKGDLTLTADSGSQPYVSYNDVIYLAAGHVITAAASYAPTRQKTNDMLTIKSQVEENGTDIIQAASADHAESLLDAKRISCLSGPMSREDGNQSMIELNSVRVTYYNGIPGAEGTVASSWAYEPYQKGVFAMNFDAAGTDSDGEAIEGFTMPTGKNLSHWAVMKKDEDGSWKYLTESGALAEDENQAIQYVPGSTLPLTSNDIALVAVYTDADYFVMYYEGDERGAMGNATQRENQFGKLMVEGVNYNADQQRYFYANDKEIILQPTPRDDDKGLGVLQKLEVYVQVDKKTYDSLPETDRDKNTNMNTTYFWQKKVVAEVDAASGKVTGVDKNYAGLNARASEDGSGLVCTTPAQNILVKTRFKQAMVRLDITDDESGEIVRTAWYDVVNDAYNAALDDHAAKQTRSYTITPLVANTTDKIDGDAIPGDDTYGVVKVNGGKSATMGKPGADGEALDLTMDLNGFTLDMSDLGDGTIALENQNDTIKNGVLYTSADEGVGYQVSSGCSLTVENAMLYAPKKQTYDVEVQEGGKLAVNGRVVLGRVHLCGQDTLVQVLEGAKLPKTKTTLCVDNDSLTGNGTRKVLDIAEGLDGNEMRSNVILRDADTRANTLENWFLGTDGRIYEKVAALVTSLSADPAEAIVGEEQEDRWSADGYPIYWEYQSEYGYNSDLNVIHLRADLIGAEADQIGAVGTVEFVVTSGGRRVFTTAAMRKGDSFFAEFHALANLRVGTDYQITATWRGEGEYAARYASYWNENYVTGTEGYHDMLGVNGTTISGRNLLTVNKKSLESEDVSISVSNKTAEYIGPKGAEQGYTSWANITVNDATTDSLLVYGKDYLQMYRLLTTEETDEYAGEVDGVQYYYAENGYRRADGSGDGSGYEVKNAKNINGADVGLYSVELVAVDDSENYTDLSGWKGALFEITPYTGSLYLSVPNHVLASNASTEAQFRAAIEKELTKQFAVTVTDQYGNKLDLAGCQLDFKSISGGASRNDEGWPKSEGLYNVIATASGKHSDGTLTLDGVADRNDSNYSDYCVGYNAMLLTAQPLNVFMVPHTLTVPYTGEVYTDSKIKALDGVEVGGYTVWVCAVNEDGKPVGENGQVILTEQIPTAGKDRSQLSVGEYRLEIGTAQHIPQATGSYTMFVTDGSGKYRGLGHLNISGAEITTAGLTPDTETYTGENHNPVLEVRNSKNGLLTNTKDYTVAVKDSTGALIVAPVNKGEYTYIINGIHNYVNTANKELTYYVCAKNIKEGDTVGAGEVTLEATQDIVLVDNESVTPIFRLYYNGMVLEEGKDEDYTYVIYKKGTEVSVGESVSEAGEYIVRVSGVNNYMGTREFPLHVYGGAETTGALTVTNADSYIYHAGNFDSYDWINSIELSYQGKPVDISKCETTLFRDIAGTNAVSEDTILDAGIYFVKVTINDAEEKERLGLDADEEVFGLSTMHIWASPVTVSPVNKSKTYGDKDPVLTEYTTDLLEAKDAAQDTITNGFYSRDKGYISGSFTREQGEDVVSGGYPYSLGSFSAGPNYRLTVDSTSRFTITAKDVADQNTVIIDSESAVAYTGYGLSPVDSVRYDAQLGSYQLVFGAHYEEDYERWVPCGNHPEGEECSPRAHQGDADADTHWEAMSVTPVDVGWYRLTVNGGGKGTNDNYTGTRQLVYQIAVTGGALEMAVMGEATRTYKAAAYTPNVEVRRSGFSLPTDSYKMTYSFAPADGSATVTAEFTSGVTEFTNAGVYTIYAVGTGNYAGSTGETRFTILPKDLSADDTADGTQAVNITVDADHFTYDGDPKEATVEAKYSGVDKETPDTLTQGTDYSLSYSNHVNAGEDTAKVTIRGQGNYTGTREVSYSIAVKSVQVAVGNTEKTYGDLDPTYTYKIYDEDDKEMTGVLLTGSTEREAGENVGEYDLTGGSLASGKNFSVRLKDGQKLTITPKAIGTEDETAAAKISVNMPAAVMTNGSLPTVGLTYWAGIGTMDLTKGEDFTVTYFTEAGEKITEVPEAGTACYARITAKDGSNYTGQIQQSFTVVEEGSLMTITADPTVMTYSGQDGQTVTLTAKLGTEDVTKSTTFTVKGIATDGSPVSVTVTGNTFVATTAGIYLVEAAGHTGSGESAKTTFGTATVVVQPKDISQTDMTAGELNGVYGYTGQSVEIPQEELNALLSWKGEQLTLGKDFVVSYSNSVEPGKATLTIHGKGNYTGSRDFTFTIGETHYSLTYHGNGNTGGTVPVDSALYENGATALAAAGDSMSRNDGSLFYGWSEEQITGVVTSRQQLTGNWYKAGQLITMTGNMNLYAIWAADENGNKTPDFDEGRYTVTYASTSYTGAMPEDKNSYIPGSVVTALSGETLVTRSGYKLLGWTREAADKTLNTSNEYVEYVSQIIQQGGTFLMGEENVTLHAVWGVDSNNNGKEDWKENNQYVLIYDANGGSGENLPAPAILEAGVQSTQISDVRLTREGFVQIGWTTNRGGKNAPGVVTEKGQLDADNGFLTLGGVQYTYCSWGDTYGFTPSDNPAIIYALWAKDANGNGTPDYEEEPVSLTYASVAADVRADALPETVTGILPGASLALAGAPTGTLEGGKQAVFLGWTESKTDAETVYARGKTCGSLVGDPYTVGESDVTLYAVWGAADYNAGEFAITVTAGTGGSAESDKASVIAGESASITITPSQGYVLDTVYVNGENKTASVADGKLNLSDIQGDQLVSVSFKRASFTARQPAAATYTGAKQEPALTVQDVLTGAALPRSSYTAAVSYNGAAAVDFAEADFTDAGSYEITITGTGDYAGTETRVTYVIQPKNIADADVALEDIANQIFTGKAVMPEPELRYNSMTLVKGTDFGVSYYDNVQAGEASLVITGKGNYTGVRNAKFTITPADGQLQIGEIADKVYDGLPYQPAVTVTADGTTLTEGKDYDLRYSADTINKGEVTVTVTGKGDFSGTRTASYQIQPKALDNSQADSGTILVEVAEASYTGKAQEPKVTVSYRTADGRTLLLQEGADYELEYSDNTNAGTGKVKITGKGNYSKSITETFTIRPAEGKNLTVDAAPASNLYNGAEQTPTVTVKDEETTLTEGKDYEISYTAVSGKLGETGKPLAAGTYTVTVTGLGNYEGFAGTASYTIQAIAFGDVSLKGEFIYDGTEKEAAVTVKDLNGEILTEGVDYELEYSDNVNAGTAMVKVIGKGNYASTALKPYEIQPAVLTIVPKNTEKTYGDADGELTYDVTGKPEQGADPAITGALSRKAGEMVGEYDFVRNTLHETSGNYTLELEKDSKFTITPKSIGDGENSDEKILESVTKDGVTVGYTGQAYDQSPALLYQAAQGSLLLSKGTDYELTFANADGEEVAEAKAVGTYTVTVTGIGNYQDSFTFTLTITESVLGVEILGGNQVTYNGEDQKPTLGDKPGQVQVTGVDGTPANVQITYYDADGKEVTEIVNAGRYTLEVRADNYQTSAKLDFVVLPKQLEDSMVSTPADAAYIGSSQQPEVTVQDTAPAVITEADYTVSYGENTQVGAATVTVTGQGNYTGSVTKTFNILAKELAEDEVEMSRLPDVEYNGMAQLQKPTVTLRRGEEEVTLIEGVDYRLAYAGDMVNVTEDGVTVTVVGMGNYSGELAAGSYQITPREIQKGWITVTPDSLTHTGSALTPAVTVKDGQVQLVEGVDYELTYADNTGKGQATVTVTGKGNYTGTPERHFTITENASSLTVTVQPDDTVTYNGKDQKPALQVKSGSRDVTYTATYSYNGEEKGEFTSDSAFVEAGVYVIRVAGTGDYEGAKGSVVFTIRPAVFTAGEIDPQDYTGAALTPKPTVKHGDTVLEEGADYVLSYRDNVAVGTATVTVTGMGNYAGCTQTVEFTITGENSLFTVIYDGNGSTGGEVPSDTDSHYKGSTVTILAGVPTRENAVFLGWVPDTAPAEIVDSKEAQDAYTTLYRAGGSFVITANTRLYALWAKDADNNGRPDYAETPEITASAGVGGSVSPDGKTSYVWGQEKVVYTIRADKGYSFSGVTVDGKAVAVSTEKEPTALVKNGDTYTYTFDIVTEDHVILATFRANSGGGGGGTIVVPDEKPRPKPNPDMPELVTDDHFAYIQGTPEGNFEPNGEISRAEVATILTRLICGGLEVPGGKTSSFTDVSADAWYYDAVAYLEQYKLIQGVGDGRFEPERSITRAEFAAMMMRFFVVEKYQGDPIFSDVDSDHWAYDYINEAHAYGFVLGYTDGSFGPEQKIRRAEAVTLVNRVLEREADQDYIQAHKDQMVTYADTPETHWAYYAILEASNAHDFRYNKNDEVWKNLRK